MAFKKWVDIYLFFLPVSWDPVLFHACFTAMGLQTFALPTATPHHKLYTLIISSVRQGSPTAPASDCYPSVGGLGCTAGGERWGNKSSFLCIYSHSPFITLLPELHLLSGQWWHWILIGEPYCELCIWGIRVVHVLWESSWNHPAHPHSHPPTSPALSAHGAKKVGDHCSKTCAKLSLDLCSSSAFPKNALF